MQRKLSRMNGRRSARQGWRRRPHTHRWGWHMHHLHRTMRWRPRAPPGRRGWAGWQGRSSRRRSRRHRRVRHARRRIVWRPRVHGGRLRCRCVRRWLERPVNDRGRCEWKLRRPRRETPPETMLTARCLGRALTRPQPAQLRQAAALYSRRAGRQQDGLGGWYNERLRATTILSVKKDDKLVSGRYGAVLCRARPLAGVAMPTRAEAVVPGHRAILRKLPSSHGYEHQRCLGHSPLSRRLAARCSSPAVHHRRWPSLTRLTSHQAQREEGAAQHPSSVHDAASPQRRECCCCTHSHGLHPSPPPARRSPRTRAAACLRYSHPRAAPHTNRRSRCIPRYAR